MAISKSQTATGVAKYAEPLTAGAVPRCAQLHVVMYHYVREFSRTKFPRLKGLEWSEFRQQLDTLSQRYEMASLESALALLAGDYRPERDLCLLTFDDGLREHYERVTPELRARGIQGLFFVITGALEEGRVAAVHQNHFLMAGLEFSAYREKVLRRLEANVRSIAHSPCEDRARAVYRWDTPEVAQFKFLLNFQLEPQVRDEVLRELFVTEFGSERDFSRDLYVTWSEAAEMQAAGMVLGGHTHSHQALATLGEAEQTREIETCARLLKDRLRPQSEWPFSYPYGKPREAYTEFTAGCVRQQGFCCAFSTAVGSNAPAANSYELRRIDTKDVS